MRKIISSLFILSIISCFSSFSQTTTDWAKFSRYEQQNNEINGKPYCVLLGDSIFEIWTSNVPGYLESHNITNRGISGQTSSHMLVRMRQDVIDLHPKYVVIMAGTNDLARNNGEISVEHIFGNIQSMVELAKCNKIKPILCSVLPSKSFFWRKEVGDPTEDINKLNEMIKAYAKKMKCPYVDFNSAMSKPDGSFIEEYTYDGVHPSVAGLNLMGEILLPILK